MMSFCRKITELLRMGVWRGGWGKMGFNLKHLITWAPAVDPEVCPAMRGKVCLFHGLTEETCSLNHSKSQIGFWESLASLRFSPLPSLWPWAWTGPFPRNLATPWRAGVISVLVGTYVQSFQILQCRALRQENLTLRFVCLELWSTCPWSMMLSAKTKKL